jgi:dihydropyrimidinase
MRILQDTCERRCSIGQNFQETIMTEPAYDLIIRGGRVATTTDVFEADVAISGETIAAIGRGLGPAKREVDARGKLVLPGGVDSHCHIEQL